MECAFESESLVSQFNIVIQYTGSLCSLGTETDDVTMTTASAVLNSHQFLDLKDAESISEEVRVNLSLLNFLGLSWLIKMFRKNWFHVYGGN